MICVGLALQFYVAVDVINILCIIISRCIRFDELICILFFFSSNYTFSNGSTIHVVLDTVLVLLAIHNLDNPLASRPHEIFRLV